MSNISSCRPLFVENEKLACIVNYEILLYAKEVQEIRMFYPFLNIT